MHQHRDQRIGQNNGMSAGLMVGGCVLLLLLAGLFLSLGGPVGTVVVVAAILAMVLMHTGMMGGHKGH